MKYEPFGVYDIEARGAVKFVVAATLVEGDSLPRFHTSIRHLYEYMRASGVRRWYAHNGGNYDILFLLPFLCAERCTFRVQGSRVIGARVGTGNATTEFLDSVKLLPTRLADIAAALGMAKVEIDDFETITDTDDVRARCAVDCDILLRALVRVRDIAGELPATLASWGIGQVAAYGQPALPLSLSEAFRPAVFGGRVEVFQEHVGAHEPVPLYVSDVRSEYPSIAAGALPGRYKGVGAGLSGLHLYYGRVHVPSSLPIPPIPFRRPDDDRIVFPTGSWNAWLCEPEVQFLLELGGRFDVYETHTFAPCFAAAKFVQEHWTGRQNAAPGSFESLWHKACLNWTLGKFSEYPEREVLQSYESAKDVPASAELYLDGLDLYKVTRKSAPRLAHTVAGAWITSGGRCVVGRALCSIPEWSAYCDTDAVFSWMKRPNVVYGKGLGEWDAEVDGVVGRAHFAAPKTYYLEQADGTPIKARAKGFSSFGRNPEESERIDRDLVVALAAGKSVPVKRLMKAKEIFRAGGQNEEADLKFSDVNEKSMHFGRPGKRYKFADGTTRPYSIDEVLALAEAA